MNHNLYTLGYLSGPVDAEATIQAMNDISSGNVPVDHTYETTSNDDLVDTAGKLAGSSVDSSLAKVSQLMQSTEVQDTLKSMGLDVVVKNTSREAVKNILSLLGVWYVTGFAKEHLRNKYVLGGLGVTVLAFYMMSGKSEANTVAKELNSQKLA